MITKEYIKTRLIALENYLNQDWQGLSHNFVERLCARAEYDKLTKELYEKK